MLGWGIVGNRRLAGILATLLLALAISPARAERIVVSCAASLQDVVRSAAAAFHDLHADVAISVNTGGSNLLARQISEGVRIDLLVSADERTIDRLASRGMIDSSSVVCLARNRVVVISPADRPMTVRTPADLAEVTIRGVAVADTSVPIGYYTDAYIRAVGLRGRLLDRFIYIENSRAILSAVETGSVDLGFVYATDARTTDRVRVVWEVPRLQIPPVRVMGGIVAGTANRPSSAAFLAYLRSPETSRLMEQAGFLPPGDASD